MDYIFLQGIDSFPMIVNQDTHDSQYLVIDPALIRIQLFPVFLIEPTLAHTLILSDSGPCGCCDVTIPKIVVNCSNRHQNCHIVETAIS